MGVRIDPRDMLRDKTNATFALNVARIARFQRARSKLAYALLRDGIDINNLGPADADGFSIDREIPPRWHVTWVGLKSLVNRVYGRDNPNRREFPREPVA